MYTNLKVLKLCEEGHITNVSDEVTIFNALKLDPEIYKIIIIISLEHSNNWFSDAENGGSRTLICPYV